MKKVRADKMRWISKSKNKMYTIDHKQLIDHLIKMKNNKGDYQKCQGDFAMKRLNTK